MNFGSNNLIKISTEKDAFERLFFMPPDCCKSDEKGQMAVIRALGYKQVSTIFLPEQNHYSKVDAIYLL